MAAPEPEQNGQQAAEQQIDDTDLAQAFKDLAKGERTAAALEGQLDSLEKKIDELLARVDQDQQVLDSHKEKPTDDSSQQTQPKS